MRLPNSANSKLQDRLHGQIIPEVNASRLHTDRTALGYGPRVYDNERKPIEQLRELERIRTLQLTLLTAGSGKQRQSGQSINQNAAMQLSYRERTLDESV